MALQFVCEAADQLKDDEEIKQAVV